MDKRGWAVVGLAIAGGVVYYFRRQTKMDNAVMGSNQQATTPTNANSVGPGGMSSAMPPSNNATVVGAPAQNIYPMYMAANGGTIQTTGQRLPLPTSDTMVPY